MGRAEQLKAIGEKLVAERRMITGGDDPMTRMLDHEGRGSLDTAEAGQAYQDDEVHLGIAERNTEKLVRIDAALQRLRGVSAYAFGKCLTCNKNIPIGRLDVVPHAECCVEHQEEFDEESGLETVRSDAVDFRAAVAAENAAAEADGGGFGETMDDDDDGELPAGGNA